MKFKKHTFEIFVLETHIWKLSKIPVNWIYLNNETQIISNYMKYVVHLFSIEVYRFNSVFLYLMNYIRSISRKYRKHIYKLLETYIRRIKKDICKI